MESIYTELALYGTKNEFARTDIVFIPISEVCDGMVSLTAYRNRFDVQAHGHFIYLNLSGRDFKLPVLRQNFELPILCKCFNMWPIGRFLKHQPHR